jgi:hypothetical protein
MPKQNVGKRSGDERGVLLFFGLEDLLFWNLNIQKWRLV